MFCLLDLPGAENNKIRNQEPRGKPARTVRAGQRGIS